MNGRYRYEAETVTEMTHTTRTKPARAPTHLIYYMIKQIGKKKKKNHLIRTTTSPEMYF